LSTSVGYDAQQTVAADAMRKSYRKEVARHCPVSGPNLSHLSFRPNYCDLGPSLAVPVPNRRDRYQPNALSYVRQLPRAVPARIRGRRSLAPERSRIEVGRCSATCPTQRGGQPAVRGGNHLGQSF